MEVSDISEVAKARKTIGILEKKLSVKDCQYPWSWMVVSNGGKVKPCCWTGKSVGSVFDGAEAVWNGETMQDLRQAILADRVHPVCAGAPCPYVLGAKAEAGRKSAVALAPSRQVYDFDEDWYMGCNPDVAAGVASGNLSSAYKHYRVFGQFEGRQARYDEYVFDRDFVNHFDERWYVDQYPDVRRAVDYGEISSALEHFYLHGQFERRKFKLAALMQPLHNHKDSMLEFLAGKLRTASRPTVLTFDVTTVCNIKCVMCPHGMNQIKAPQHLPEEALDYVVHYMQVGTRVQMSGIGEPLMSPMFWKILEASKTRPDVHIRVNSNALLWNGTNIERILDSNLREVSFSIDSARPETYMKIRGAKLERVLRNVKALVEKKRVLGKRQPIIYLNMTLMRENIEEVVEFVELASALGVDKARVWHLDAFGDEADWVVDRDGWVFDYQAQMLDKFPEMSNQYVYAAKRRANELGLNFTFVNDREILFDF